MSIVDCPPRAHGDMPTKPKGQFFRLDEVPAREEQELERDLELEAGNWRVRHDAILDGQTARPD